MTSRIRPALSTAAACGALALLAAAPAQAAQRFVEAVEPIAGAEVAQPNGDHALTVGGDGRAALLWGTNGGMRAALRPAGGPFGAPLPVGAGTGTALPRLASNAAGHTVATWRHSVGPDPEQVWAAIRPAGAAAFGPAFQVSDNSVATPSVQPDVAVDGNGRALFVWLARTVADDASSTRVMHRYVAADGTPITAPTFLTGTDNGFPRVVMNEAGVAAVGYRGQFSAVSGTPAVVRIDAAASDYDYQTFGDGSSAPVLALDPAGNAVAAYPASGALHARYRPAGAAADFGPLQVVDGPGTPSGAVVGVDGAGNATVAFELASGPNRSVQAAVRPAGGASEFGAPQVVRPVGTANPDHLSLAVGADGTALLGWVDDSDADGPGYAAARPAGAAQFDAPTGPIALQGSVVGTTRAAIGGGVGIVSFASRAEEATRYQLDALVYAHEAQVPVDPPNGPGGGADAAPRISQPSLLRKRFRVSGRATARVAAKRRRAAVKKGTAFRFTLSEAATVRIAIERRASGRRRGGKCVRPTRALRAAKRCTRFVKVGTLTRRDLATGRRSVAFSGRIGRRALRPGAYRAVLTATDGGGKASKPVRLAFRVVR